MKIIFLTVTFILISAVSLFFVKRNRKNKSEEVIETSGESSQPETLSAPSEEISQKTERFQETIEEMAKRLEKLSSVDKDKPFAKISKPSISEVPTELPDSLEKEPETPKAKKRRYKKKNSPKKSEE